MATNELLNDLADRLDDSGKKLADYGLPEPEQAETELQRALIQYDVHQQQSTLLQLNELLPSTPEQ